MDIQSRFVQAKQAIMSGQRDQGRSLLINILRDDPKYIPAWLWLSGVLDDQTKRRECLERVLKLDPDNVAAHHGLEVLNMQLVANRAEPLPEPAETPEEKVQTVKRLGEYLVKEGFITQRQLDSALTEQQQESRYGRMTPLGDILLSKRWLTMNALNKILDKQQKERQLFGLRSNRRLGEFLVKQNLISEKQLQEVVARQASLKRQGQDFQLGELLVLSGMLSRQQLQRAVDEHQTRFMQQLNS